MKKLLYLAWLLVVLVMVVACVKKNGDIQDNNQDSLKVTETTTMSEENAIWDESAITAEPDTRMAEQPVSESLSDLYVAEFSSEDVRGTELSWGSGSGSDLRMNSRASGIKASANRITNNLSAGSISEPTLGFSVGGAKDINNFRDRKSVV